MTKPIDKKLRNSVLERDNNSCQKCNRVDSLEVHHITSRYDDGTDEPDNLITLCNACHEEWHSLESRSTLPFQQWLEVPPLNILIYAYINDWSDEMTARQMKEAIQLMHKFAKQQFLLRRAIDERVHKRDRTPTQECLD